MKRAIAINCLLASLVLGCETTPAEGFQRIYEEGKVRCAFTDEVDENGDPVDDHCDILSEKGWCCSGPSVDPSEDVCMNEEECLKQQELPGIVWRAECDDPADCIIKYPDAGIPLREWVCCQSFHKDHRWSLCKHRDECPYIAGDQNEGCLSTWTCPPDTTCLESIFRKNTFYCHR